MNGRQLRQLLKNNPDLAACGAPAAEDNPLAARFEREWGAAGGLPYVCEYRFHPVRRWSFDYAWPALHVALELEGGVYSGGRHVRAQGFLRDLEKYNAAVMLGWRLLRLGTGFSYAQVEEMAGWMRNL